MPPKSRTQQKAACADLNRINKGQKPRTFKSRDAAKKFCAPVKK